MVRKPWFAVVGKVNKGMYRVGIKVQVIVAGECFCLCGFLLLFLFCGLLFGWLVVVWGCVCVCFVICLFVCCCCGGGGVF